MEGSLVLNRPPLAAASSPAPPGAMLVVVVCTALRGLDGRVMEDWRMVTGQIPPYKTVPRDQERMRPDPGLHPLVDAQVEPLLNIFPPGSSQLIGKLLWPWAQRENLFFKDQVRRHGCVPGMITPTLLPEVDQWSDYSIRDCQAADPG